MLRRGPQHFNSSCWHELGPAKKTIVTAYKSIIRSVIFYAAPIWFPNTAHTNMKKNYTLQNTALRIATGCVKITSTGYLHADTQVLPLHDSLSLLSTQFLARALQPTHPSHKMVTSPPGPRNMKNTLQSLLIHRVKLYMEDGVVPPPFLQRNHTLPPHRCSHPSSQLPPRQHCTPTLTALHSPSFVRVPALHLKVSR